jgi:hypothetical protein
LLFQAIESSPLPPDESFAFTASATPITRSQVRKFQVQDIDALAISGPVCGVNTRTDTTAIAVEDYERAICDISYDSTRCPSTQLGHNASILEVSAHFRLNRLQHVAFALIANPLLRQITGSSTSTIPSPMLDGTPLIVTGAGGTGKSQVVAAVRALASSWNHPHAVAAVASTGIAAANLQGLTMHSSVGLGINAKVVPKHITSPTDSLLKQWAPVRCVIADEVSMTDLGFFGLWEESLRYAKDNLDEDYGGLIVVLMFDHCQLRTVKGMPMFRTSNGDTPLTTAQERGLLLYRKISKVVYLTENMRFTQDPEWGQWLANARLGIWTPACRAHISSSANDSLDRSSLPLGVIKTISTDNRTRAATNELALKIAVRCFGALRKVYVIPAQLSRRALPHEMAMIRQLPDNRTGNIPLFLTLYVSERLREVAFRSHLLTVRFVCCTFRNACSCQGESVCRQRCCQWGVRYRAPRGLG